MALASPDTLPLSDSEGFVRSLPDAVRVRVTHLQSLQEQWDKLDEQFHAEVAQLEKKYEKLQGMA